MRTSLCEAAALDLGVLREARKIEPDPYVLWAAVLRQAVRDYYTLLDRKKAWPHLAEQFLFKHSVRELETWFRSNRQLPGDFVFCCTVLDLDPDYVRRLVKSQMGAKQMLKRLGRETVPVPKNRRTNSGGKRDVPPGRRAGPRKECAGNRGL